MLRKRASFKPNLNQVRPEQTPAAPAVPAPPATTPAPAATPALTVDPATPTTSTSTSTAFVPVTPPAVPEAPVITAILIEDPAPQDVTKVTSLRNSAYKNVKLKDLLFFNPPLTKDQKRHKKNERKRQNQVQASDAAAVVEAETVDSNKMVEDEEAEEPSLVPKIKLGPDGQLVLDESSTVINRKNSIKAKEAIVEDNEEVISRTNYDSYRRKPSSTSQTKWSIEDTQKFYHALSILGTDFSMMESLLFSGYRSRTELHKKFKREERINKAKIDVALSKRISLNSEELDGLKDIFYKC